MFIVLTKKLSQIELLPLGESTFQTIILVITKLWIKTTKKTTSGVQIPYSLEHDKKKSQLGPT